MSIAKNLPDSNMTELAAKRQAKKAIASLLALADERIAERDARSLDSFLRQIGPLPPYSAVLGRCEDGLPMLVDLSDPASGAILVVGEAGMEVLPRAILATAARINPPDQVSFSVISPDPGAFDDLARLPGCELLISTYDRRSAEWVIEQAAVAEQRKSGRERGPVQLLAIHDLGVLLGYKEYETGAYLRWLVEFGPRQGVIPLVTARVSDVAAIQTLEPRLLPLFITRIAATTPRYTVSMRGGETTRFYPLEV